MEGDLTIRDVTRAVTLDFEFCGTATDPWDNLRAGYMAEGEIDREDFAVSWNRRWTPGVRRRQRRASRSMSGPYWHRHGAPCQR